MSGQLQQVIGAGVSVATSGQSEQTQQIWNRLWCWVTSRGDVTFSRNHETEADQIGLTLMAIAGYNPEEAIAFWTRMANSTEAPPEFLSTPVRCIENS
jgi:predicted Zn-dependent protease